PAEPTKATPPAPEAPAAVAPTEPAKAPEQATLGQLAPDFALTDTDGKAWKLSDHRGKIVVIEWFNPGCPFVKYAYGDGPLKDLARRSTSDEVLWVNVNSGAPGKQGHGLEANQAAKTEWGIAHPILIDEDGAVGRRYDAKTTPGMVVVDKDGKLVYRGALDNAPLGRVEGDEAPVNYVSAALADLAAGRPVATPETTSYGCSVKY
ncbi:MAG: redoxin domain-containing protein, partial [Deltaproteobacteria bacterium]